jgi:hypothetical protein
MTIDTIDCTKDKNRMGVTDYDGEVTVYGEGEMPLSPGAIVDEGELVGYDEEGNLYVFENTPGSLNSDLPSDSQFDEFAEINSEAMNLFVSGYLDAGSLTSNSQAATGDELYTLAERNLESSPEMRIEADEEGSYGIVELV